MLRNVARMLVLALFVLLAGVAGCASDRSGRSTSESPNASGVANSASHGSCH
jgi:hypothetical protein